MIKPQFSFLYDGKPYDGNGAIKTTLEVKKHEKFDAVEWVVWYENTTEQNSGILSEIKDIDNLIIYNNSDTGIFSFNIIFSFSNR